MVQQWLFSDLAKYNGSLQKAEDIIEIIPFFIRTLSAVREIQQELLMGYNWGQDLCSFLFLFFCSACPPPAQKKLFHPQFKARCLVTFLWTHPAVVHCPLSEAAPGVPKAYTGCVGFKMEMKQTSRVTRFLNAPLVQSSQHIVCVPQWKYTFKKRHLVI